MKTRPLQLTLRHSEFGQDAGGHNEWREVMTEKQFPADRTALLLCDVWDSHWSRGARERLDAMIPRMNAVVQAARDRGVRIIHAPSDTMESYRDTPARQRIREIPPVEPPDPLPHEDPPLPVDASGGGSDTGEDKSHHPWTRQHPGIDIDRERDVISDNGREIYSFLRANRIDTLLIMGVHTNMCVLHRSFAIKQMVRWGIHPILIRDLTDTMYNPANPPYVSHAEGTRLVVEFIEKFWCPSTLSDHLLTP